MGQHLRKMRKMIRPGQRENDYYTVMKKSQGEAGNVVA